MWEGSVGSADPIAENKHHKDPGKFPLPGSFADTDASATILALADERDRIDQTNVRYWHKTDISKLLSNVRFWGQSGHDPLRRTCRLLTQSGHCGNSAPSSALV